MMSEDLTVPLVEREGLGYKLIWEDGVEILVDRLYNHTDYHVDAELTVNDMHQLNPHLMGPLRTSITRTFRNVISELEESASGRNWAGRLKQTTFYVLREERKGQPLIKLSEMKAPERPPERITGIAYEGMPTLIFGDGGMGKSTLGVALMTMTQAGVGLGDEIATVKGNCMVLDYESSWEETWRRSNDVIRAQELSREAMIYYRFCALPLRDEVEYIRSEILKNDIDVVLIDSAGPACGGEPENAEKTLQFFQAIRMLSDYDRPVTTVTLAHVAKGGGGKAGPFGSVYWTNLPRNTFELKKAQKRGDNFIDLALHHRKTNIGILRDPLGFRMTWSDGIYVEALSVQEHAALSVDLPYGDRVELALQNSAEGMTLDELAEYLDVANSKSLSASLSRDKRFKSEDGIWQLNLSY